MLKGQILQAMLDTNYWSNGMLQEKIVHWKINLHDIWIDSPPHVWTLKLRYILC